MKSTDAVRQGYAEHKPMISVAEAILDVGICIRPETEAVSCMQTIFRIVVLRYKESKRTLGRSRVPAARTAHLQQE